ncbi:MAG: hypothetical protein HUK14_01565 [Muribaculaceae bacterium]|nr:hypothetical protein [Muribaculaceae bacterium]
MSYYKLMLSALIMTVLSVPMSAQKKIQSDIYRRNSLCTYFVPDFKLLVSENGVADEIRAFLNKYEISDKFDDHTIGDRYVSIKGISATEEDLQMVDPSRNKKKKASFLDKGLSAVNNLFGNNKAYQETMAQHKAEFSAVEKSEFASEHPEIFSASTEDEFVDNAQKTAARINRYLSDEKLANKLIAKWFNAKESKSDGSHYDLSLIQDRGLYNASELDMLRASEATRKWAILKDAGMELIPHTFVTFTDFEVIDGKNYKERQHNSNAGKQSSKIVGSLFGKSQTEMEQSHKDDESVSAGYVITATTYLFQLEWTEKELEKFINEYWEADISKLLNSNEFTLKYLDCEYTTIKTMEDVRGKGGKWFKNVFKDAVNHAVSTNLGHKSQEQADAEIRANHESERQNKTLLMTEQALIRSIDATYADLMNDFEDFKVKAPLIDVEKDKITAFIGLKEGITEKSKFEVLERTYDEKKGVFGYKKVGKLSVDKKRIWDNRYTLIDEGANVVGKGNKAETIDRTYLTGSYKDMAPGMLIRQIK